MVLLFLFSGLCNATTNNKQQYVNNQFSFERDRKGMEWNGMKRKPPRFA
jgi:hypothetical protein